MSDDDAPEKGADPALHAALCQIQAAADPLSEVAADPFYRTANPDSFAMWAIRHGEVLTVGQIRTLANAFDLFALALMPAASETRH